MGDNVFYLSKVVASSTVLSGKASEPVAPAPQPRPGNKRGQEKAERVEKPPGKYRMATVRRYRWDGKVSLE